MIYLELNQNQMNILHPAAFKPLVSLEALTLDKDQFTEVSGDTWTGLNSLIYLSLGDNQISVIKPGGLSNLPRMISVDLKNNKLTTIEENTVDAEKIPGIRLRGNPINCDSQMCWLKKSSLSTGIGIMTSNVPPPSLNWTDLDCEDADKQASKSGDDYSAFESFWSEDYQEFDGLNYYDKL